MLRKLVTAIIGASALVPGVVFGLGMGEVELESFLNQPLDARIELLQTGNLSRNEVIASLASAREFSAAGVDRSFFLSQLNFEVVNEDGKSYLKITSKRPVTEPYLNFLVEVQWPAGRLLREYTLLLDPPEFKDDLPLAIRAPERAEPSVAQVPSAPDSVGVELTNTVSDAEPDVSPVVEEPQVAAEAPVEADPVDKAVALDELDEMADASADEPMALEQQPASQEPPQGSTIPVASEQMYTVQRGDTLSKIVQETQVNDVPMARALVAYQYLNPDAFIDDNLNLIKTGAVLRVPSEEQIRQISRQEAIQEIAAQNKAWRAKLQARQATQDEQQLAGRQLDGTGRELAPQEASKDMDEGRLSIVTPGADGSTDEGASGRGEGVDSTGMQSLQNQLALETEEVEKYSLENEGLVSELEELTSIVEKTDKVLALKDDQIAALQAQLQQLRDEESAIVNQNQAQSSDEMADVTAMDVTSSDEMTSDEMSSEDMQSDSAALDRDMVEPSADMGMEEPADEAMAEPPVPESGDEGMQEFDEAIAEQPPQTSIFTNPLYLGGAGGLVLLALAFLWWRSRQDEDDDDFDYDEEIDETEDELDEAEAADEQQAFSTEKLDKQLLEAEDDFDIDTLLSEADIYVAYGHFPKAVAMLQDGLKESPDSLGLNMKLLEVHAEAKDTAEFEKVEQHVRSLTDDDEVLARVNGMRSELGLAAGEGPEQEDESFSEEETQFLSEETSVPAEVEDEDFLSLADIEAELDVGGQEFESAKSGADTFEEEQTAESRFDAEETQVNGDEELDLGGGEFDFNFEETSVPEEDVSLETDLESFSPDDALADIDEEIGSMDDQAELDLDLDSEAPSETPDLSADMDIELSEPDDAFSLDDDAVETPAPESVVDTASVPLSSEDASLLEGVDEVGTKLDLATAYIEMGDHEGARDILDEVLLEGNDDQQKLAKELLEKVG